MLEKGLHQQTLAYLHQVLGEDAVRVKPGRVQADLPYFLQDAYEVAASELLGHEVTLACAKGLRALSAQQIDQHARRMREQFNTPVIVALPQVAAGERKQLIERGVAFVVPGRQLYAPQLGMILSERFGMAVPREQAQVSPATQALLIGFLLRQPVTGIWHPSADAAAMGYTAMTATRALRELLAFNLFELQTRGRAKYLRLAMTHRQLWEKARPCLMNPVQRTLWTYDQRMLQAHDARAAGESALALCSMLNEPRTPVIAVTADAVAQAKAQGVIFEPRQLGDAIEVQVWRYPPTTERDQRAADRLSVWLSLEGSTDARIQMALDDIDRSLPW